MAEKTTVMTSDLGYRTQMRLSAELTGKTLGNTREIKAVGVIDFWDSGYGSYAYAPVTYVLEIDGKNVKSWAPTEVEKKEYEIEGSLYAEAGRSVSVRMYADVSWSGADFSYPPNPNNGASSVSVVLECGALQSEIREISDFVLEDEIKAGITKYDASFRDELRIISGEDEVKVIEDYKDGEGIALSGEELLRAYKNLDEGNYGVFTFEISTYDGGEKIGSNSLSVTGRAKGTARVATDDGWVRGVVWIKAEGRWKRAVMYVNENGWRRGI